MLILPLAIENGIEKIFGFKARTNSLAFFPIYNKMGIRGILTS